MIIKLNKLSNFKEKEYLLKEWDYEKNGELTPDKISYASNIKVWWKCKNGHSWATSPSHRTLQTGNCPYCSNKKLAKGENDLETVFPDIAREWNYEKNGLLKPSDVVYGSSKKVWWKCKLGHDYEMKVCVRAYKLTNCPICQKERHTSFIEQTILFYSMKVFKSTKSQVKFDWLGKGEIDIFIPELNLGIEYDGGYWHKDINRDLKKDILCQEHNIDLIRIRGSKCPIYETNIKLIRIENEYKNSIIEEVLKSVFDYIKEKYNLYFFIDINIDRDYIEITEKFVLGEKVGNLEELFPNVSKEWDYSKNGTITPKMVSAHSKKDFWWKCSKCGYSYKATVNRRTGSNKTGCPLCSGNIVVKGKNDIETLFPEILKEWDYDKNIMLPSEVSKGSNKKVFWKCPFGHSWEASVVNRINLKAGCPVCNHKIVGENNSLADLYPNLLEEWDYRKNERNPYTLLPKSNLLFWWKCKKCGNEFQKRISEVTRLGYPCVKCHK
ncbi:MAG: zinc-ribbon domain-containing protein [Acholeplasmatales bacterium]|nr:zinc-ribbon domain-containing protein [Acholeplasmatales bacterium]